MAGRTVTYQEDGDIPILRSGDIGKDRPSTDLLRTGSNAQVAYLQNGDVLISSIGFGSIGRTEVFQSGIPTGAVSEVTIIRQKKLDPYYLSSFVASPYGQVQIERFITGATGQLHLYPRDVRKIFVPVIAEDQQAKFRLLFLKVESHKNRSRHLLQSALAAVEAAIESGESAAMQILLAN